MKKRYFEVVGKRQTLKLNVVDGSPAASASQDMLAKKLNLDLREIDKKEYLKLTKEFADTI